LLAYPILKRARYDEGMRSVILALLGSGLLVAAEGAKSEVVGKQLTLTASASHATVAPGERIVLVLEVDLKPGMHVYAPGVEGYIPIDWKMKESASATPAAAQYPRSKKLYLKAIDETVPAYREHFRITREITIAQEDQLKLTLDGSGHFTVEGSLRYQACDDRVCYIPQELPLKWTFQYKASGQ